MLKQRVTARSSGRDDAVSSLLAKLKAGNQGWKLNGDVTVTDQRDAGNGGRVYVAAATLVTSEPDAFKEYR